MKTGLLEVCFGSMVAGWIISNTRALDGERARRSNPDFGRMVENRVIWRELIDLELQEIDREVSRFCGAAGTEGSSCKHWWTGERHKRRSS